MSGDERLAPDLETAVYRLVQESLANAIKHSAAGHVEVALTLSDDAITVSISETTATASTLRSRPTASA